MREKVRGVSLALMMATTLHAIATGNLLTRDGEDRVCGY